MLRSITLGAAALAILASPLAAAAQAQPDYRPDDRGAYANDNRDHDRDRDGMGHDERGDDRDHRDDRDYNGYRDHNRDDRAAYRADNRRADWRSYRNYDYNRPQRGYNAYYADQYYRDGRYYQPRRLGANDRIYRGRDNRYYCRRSDGTTGLVIGAIGGGVLGGAIASGGSNTLGVLLGGLGGALAGRAIDRNNVTCR